MALYKAERWQNGSKWKVADTHDLNGGSAQWYHMCNILSMKPIDFAKFLKEYDAIDIRYVDTQNAWGFLDFSFENEKSAKKFQDYLNKKAKSVQYMV